MNGGKEGGQMTVLKRRESLTQMYFNHTVWEVLSLFSFGTSALKQGFVAMVMRKYIRTNPVAL